MLRSLCLALLVASPALAQDGSLDPTFGFGGTVLTDLGGQDILEALALQPDGKIVAVGSTQGATGFDFAVARYDSDGSLDVSFGEGGVVRMHVGDAPQESALTVLADEAGVLVGGYVNGSGSSAEGVLLRLGPDGTPDASFGEDGVALAGWGADAAVLSLARLDDGRVLAAGRAGTAFALARYAPDGTLDPTFGSDGLVVTDFGEDTARINDLHVLPDGRLLAVGPSVDFDVISVALARYTPDGALDPTFGGDGRVLVPPVPLRSAPGYEVLAFSDGRFAVAGATNSHVTLWRFLADGALDASFGAGGRSVTDVPTTAGRPFARFDAAGRVVTLAAPVDGANRDLGAARLLPDGTPDAGFGDGGLASADVFAFESSSALLLQPDGSVVVGGWGGPSGAEIDFMLARFLGGPATASEPAASAGRPVLSVYPNPATARPSIAFALAAPATVRLDVYDVLGRRVAVLAEGPQPAGAHRVEWAPADLRAGLYLVRLRAGDTVATRRLVVAR